MEKIELKGGKETMRKLIVGILLMFCLLATNIHAETVEPYDTIYLPQVTSSVPLDTEGLQRMYLYCTWRIGDQGEEAIPMTGTICPETQQTYTFEDDADYYVRIDYADIGYSQISHQWMVVDTGLADEMEVNYELDIPEPPQNVFTTAYNAIIGTIRHALCQIFPFLNFCS